MQRRRHPVVVKHPQLRPTYHFTEDANARLKPARDVRPLFTVRCAVPTILQRKLLEWKERCPTHRSGGFHASSGDVWPLTLHRVVVNACTHSAAPRRRMTLTSADVASCFLSPFRTARCQLRTSTPTLFAASAAVSASAATAATAFSASPSSHSEPVSPASAATANAHCETSSPSTEAAAVRSEDVHAKNTTAAAVASSTSLPAPPIELRFLAADDNVFDPSDADLHWELLCEAHRKHGVWLNVPPQTPPSIPNVGPPTIPQVYYPPVLRDRLESMQLAYTPTHDPPPLQTTGTRELFILPEGFVAPSSSPSSPESLRASAKATAASRSTSTASSEGLSEGGEGETAENGAGRTPSSTASARVSLASPQPLQPPHTMTLQTVVKRAAIDETMLFHCSLCGKAFRRSAAAELHVIQRHNEPSTSSSSSSSLSNSPLLLSNAVGVSLLQSSAAAVAVVLEGPGPGEVIGTEEVIVATPAPISAGAHSPPHTTVPVAGGGGADSRRIRSDAVGTERLTSTPSTAKSSPSTGEAAPSSKPERPTAGDSSSAAKPISAVARLTLPDDDLVEELLLNVWDVVAIAREDIAKPKGVPTNLDALRAVRQRRQSNEADSASTTAVPSSSLSMQFDSKGGAWFIPAALVVEGQADRRKEMAEALAAKPLARATPEGAAPGIRRGPQTLLSSNAASARLNSIGYGAGKVGQLGRGGTQPSAASSRRRLVPIKELNKQYPNPFGDSPNAAIVEFENEPINPFYDVEAEAMTSADSSSPSRRGEKENTDDESDTNSGERRSSRIGSSASSEENSEPAKRADATPSAKDERMLSASESTAKEQTEKERAEEWQRRCLARPFLCPFCSAPSKASEPHREVRFRVLDALLNHVDDVHSAEGGLSALSPKEWESLYALQANPQLALKQTVATSSTARPVTAPRATKPKDKPLTHSDNTNKDGHPLSMNGGAQNEFSEGGEGGGQSSSGGTDAGAGSGSGDDKDKGRPPPISRSTTATATREKNDVSQREENTTRAPTDMTDAKSATADATAVVGAALYGAVTPDQIRVHARTAVNTVLVGVVRDVQDGYLGQERVLQVVVSVPGAPFSTKPTSSSSSFASAPSDNTGDNAVKADHAHERHIAEEDEEELVVVRCVGEQFPFALLLQQLHVGARVYVAGSLRMNRHVDDTSRRLHAYPFVQVVPPLGCLVRL